MRTVVAAQFALCAASRLLICTYYLAFIGCMITFQIFFTAYVAACFLRITVDHAFACLLGAKHPFVTAQADMIVFDQAWRLRFITLLDTAKSRLTLLRIGTASVITFCPAIGTNVSARLRDLITELVGLATFAAAGIVTVYELACIIDTLLIADTGRVTNTGFVDTSFINTLLVGAAIGASFGNARLVFTNLLRSACIITFVCLPRR
jgi:hypothetical protein